MRIIGTVKLSGLVKVKKLSGFQNLLRAWTDYSSQKWDTLS